MHKTNLFLRVEKRVRRSRIASPALRSNAQPLLRSSEDIAMHSFFLSFRARAIIAAFSDDARRGIPLESIEESPSPESNQPGVGAHCQVLRSKTAPSDDEGGLQAAPTHQHRSVIAQALLMRSNEQRESVPSEPLGGDEGKQSPPNESTHPLSVISSSACSIFQCIGANKKSARAWALSKWRIAMQLIGDLQKGHAAESFAALKHAGELAVRVAGDHRDQDHDDRHHQKGGQARFAAFETALNLRTDLEQEHTQ